MSLLVGSMMHPMTFEQWMLSEAIEPIKIDFGGNPPNYDDKRLTKMIGGDIWGAFFTFDDRLYTIQYDKNSGEMAFGVSNQIANTKAELEKLVFNDRKTLTSSALKVFNHVFYVLLDILKHNNNKTVWFSAANSDLDHFYKILLRNKFFNKKLNDLGYLDMKLENNKYVIKKGK